MRVVKWIIGIVLFLVISLGVYLTMIFDPNDFKPQIVSAVKKHTGRDLVIGKELSLTIFPKLGIRLEKVSLSNPEGFKPKEMLQVSRATVGVAFMPLFSKKIEVSSLKLNGLTINLVTKQDGRSSLDGLVGHEEEAKPAKPAEKADIKSLNVGGIAITNSQVNLVDEREGTRQQFIIDELMLGYFSLGKDTPLDFKVRAKMPDMSVVSKGKGKLRVAPDLQTVKISGLKVENTIEGEGIPNQKMEVKLASHINVALDKQRLDMKLDELTADSIKATGNLGVNYGSSIPMITGNIDFGDIDLDAMLPKNGAQSGKPAAAADGSATVAAKETEPDLTGLNKVNFNLAMKAKSLKVMNTHSQNWVMKTALRNGVLKLSEATAQLYQGKLKASGQLDARQRVPSYSFSESLEGIQIRPLLKDLAEVDMLSGTANLNTTGSGSSLKINSLKRNLVANGRFSVNDGAIYGVNIPQMIRSAKATLKGQVTQEAAQEQKTDFTSLTGSFKVSNAVLSNQDLLMASPLIRLTGAGTAHLITEALDYKLKARIVGTLKGQGAELKELQGVDIPIAITGTMKKPRYGLDMSGLVGAKLKQETEKVKEKVKQKIQEKLLKDKLFEKLRGL